MQGLKGFDALVERVQRPSSAGVFRQIASAGRRRVDEHDAALLRLKDEEGGGAGEDDDDCSDGVADAGLSAALAFGAAVDLVGGDADQRGDDFCQREVAAVGFLAHIGGQRHFGEAVRDLSGLVQLESQRGRETAPRSVRPHRHDHGHNRPAGAAMLEQADFLVHVTTCRRGGRAQHDERGGGVERG